MLRLSVLLCMSMQRYEILSKSQPKVSWDTFRSVVYVYAKIRNFKQITTLLMIYVSLILLCMSMQRYEILSKSQLCQMACAIGVCCVCLCKDTKF